MCRSILVLVAVAAVLVVPARVLAANVAITTLGFAPSSLKINQGDAVIWTNTDGKNHAVFSNKADFYSPVLTTGQSYSFVFSTTGRFDIRDNLDTHLKGTIEVKAVPEPAPPKPAPKAAAGSKSFSPVATVTTTNGGRWTYSAEPTIQTGYQSHWKNATSSAATVGVRPLFSRA